MVTTEAERPTAAVPDQPGPAALALAVCLVLSCTIIALATDDLVDADYQRRWVLFLSDLAFAAVAVAQLRGVLGLWTSWQRHQCAAAAVVLGLCLLPALAAHPSGRGVAAVLRWAAVALIALAVGRLSGASCRLVLSTFAAVTVLQVAVGIAEWAGSGPVGLSSLGEPRTLYEIGGRYASTGITTHPYTLAAWCTLGGAILLAAIRQIDPTPVWLRFIAPVPFVGIGLTMSRAGALAVGMVLASFMVAAIRIPRLRLVVAAAVAATALGGALNFSGWALRAAGSVSGSASAITSNRTQLVRQANELFADNAVLGVGPGRYVEAIESRPELVKLSSQSSRPVHVVPYLVLVEGGLVALPALLLLGWAVATRSWRAGAAGVALTAAVLPFLLLDHLHWSVPQGLLLTGLWLGALDRLAVSRTEAGQGTG